MFSKPGVKIKEAPRNLESTLPLIQERTCRSAMGMSPTCLTIYYWCRWRRQEFNIGSIIKVMIRSWLGSISGHSYSLTWYFLHHCFEPMKYWNFVLWNWTDDLWWNLFLVTSAFRHLMTMLVIWEKPFLGIHLKLPYFWMRWIILSDFLILSIIFRGSLEN